MRRYLTIILILLLCSVAPGTAAQPVSRDRSFWQDLAASPAAIPDGEKAGALALELADLLGSPDPFLRDQCGYGILTAWVNRGLLAPQDLEPLRGKLVAALSSGIGETGTDSVLRRSFSALDLSVLLARDLHRPWTTDQTFQATLEAALAYLAAERDLRGFEAGKGWFHATAHTADLLKFLARNPRLKALDQKRIVDGIARRLKTVDRVFTWGEDARLAKALLALVKRPDFNPVVFDAWLASLRVENRALWRGEMAPADYVRVRAQINTLAHLAALMAGDGETIPKGFRDDLYEFVRAIQD